MKMIIEIVLANGSARARPNRWMGGRPGPHAPSEVSMLHVTNTARTRRQKEARVRERPSRGVGEMEGKKPRPRQVKSCHVTTPNCLRAQLPFKNPD
jgi:hypothetical protein